MLITILGCGASYGAPLLGCACSTCSSNDAKNHRRRPSIWVQHLGKNIIVDPGPDFRYAALEHNISRVDAVIVTHYHYDHCSGLDDLKPISYHMNMAIPIYVSNESYHIIQSRYGYLLGHSIKPIVVDMESTCNVAGLDIFFFPQQHGKIISLGLAMQNVVYSTDFKLINSQPGIAKIKAADIWIAECLRIEPDSPAHQTLHEILALIQQWQVKLTYLTHLDHSLEYHHLLSILPKNVMPCYDGMKL